MLPDMAIINVFGCSEVPDLTIQRVTGRMCYDGPIKRITNKFMNDYYIEP